MTIPDQVSSERAFWDHLAAYDPLWAILTDPSKAGRRWDLRSFLETGKREVSLLMYQLRALGIDLEREAALDFGCGIGRLSQPFAAYFERVVGVDVSPEMVRLANEINQYPLRVRYVCNDRDDLASLGSDEFTFVYSNVVLQHIAPPRAQQYLSELLRVVTPGGLLVFQLPSHPRPPGAQRTMSRPMAGQAYRAAVRVESDVPDLVTPGSELVLTASVTNTSGDVWSQSESGPIRLGNHWLRPSGHVMLIQDDGRASVPEPIGPGQTCRVALRITIPSEPGEYELECDVVHEGISWFADRGSETWRATVNVGGAPTGQESSDEAVDVTVGEVTLALPEMSSLEPPGPLPMHGLHRDVVLSVVEQEGGRLLHLETDERCGREWVGYRYFVRKND
jgi:SAM-dependent methyltransferase